MVSPSRVLHGGMALVFFAFAGLQWNDPDPLQWMAIYACAGVAALLTALARPQRYLALATGLVALVWALALVPEALRLERFGDVAQRMDIMRPEIEIARELGGLAIVVVWMGVLWLRAARALRTSAADSNALGRS